MCNKNLLALFNLFSLHVYRCWVWFGRSHGSTSRCQQRSQNPHVSGGCSLKRAEKGGSPKCNKRERERPLAFLLPFVVHNLNPHVKRNLFMALVEAETRELRHSNLRQPNYLYLTCFESNLLANLLAHQLDIQSSGYDLVVHLSLAPRSTRNFYY